MIGCCALSCYWKVNICELALSGPLRCGLGVSAKKPKIAEERLIDRREDHIRLLREGVTWEVMASRLLTHIIT